MNEIIRKRYLNDSNFNKLVSYIEKSVNENIFTLSDFNQALILLNENQVIQYDSSWLNSIFNKKYSETILESNENIEISGRERHEIYGSENGFVCHQCGLSDSYNKDVFNELPCVWPNNYNDLNIIKNKEN